MSRELRFPSLSHGDSTGYLLLESAEWDRSDWRRNVADWLRQYETYGDGMVQHAPAMSIPIDRMADALASLAALCATDPDALAIVAKHWPRFYGGSVESILKAQKVKHREDKRQYVHTKDFTVSSAESKRHDKRWTEVCPWMNGTVQAVFGLFHQAYGSHGGALPIYHAYETIIEALANNGAIGYTSTASACPEFGGDPAMLMDAYGALSSLVRSHQERERAERLMDNYRRNLARRAESAAPIAEAS